MLCALNRTESNKVRTKRASWFDAFFLLSRFPNDAKKSTNESTTERLRSKNEALTESIF